MRSLTTTALLLALAASCLIPGPAAATTFTAGVSLADFDDLGLQARWLRPFLLRATDLSTGLTYFLDGSYLAVDGDLHLRLSDPSLRALYPLVGLRLATDLNDSDIDLNLGAGYHLQLGERRSAALEGKVVIGDADMVVATFSLFF